MPNKYFNKLKDYLNNLNAERRERTRLEKEVERELRKQMVGYLIALAILRLLKNKKHLNSKKQIKLRGGAKYAK